MIPRAGAASFFVLTTLMWALLSLADSPMSASRIGIALAATTLIFLAIAGALRGFLESGPEDRRRGVRPGVWAIFAVGNFLWSFLAVQNRPTTVALVIWISFGVVGGAQAVVLAHRSRHPAWS